MAQRGGEGMAKRARERAKQQKQEAKRQRRESRAEESTEIEAPNEAALMEEFRLLSEKHSRGQVSEDVYTEERRRIFVELGIESDEEA
jgi:hypothetical protein